MDSEQDPRPHHDRRVLLLALLAGLPGVLLSLWFLWYFDFTARLRWTAGPLLVLVWIGCAVAARQRVVRPLRTLASLLASLREGDFSSRARGADPDDALGTVIGEINALGDTLQEQRLGALEATALLRRVMAEIDVAVYAFDDTNTLVLVNRAGERLLGRAAERAVGLPAEGLGLGPFLSGDTPRVVDAMLPGATGRWEVRRGTFRQHSRPHQLLVVADLSRALREEERLAWQRLVRVLSHEINNSLAPIKSLAGSMVDLLARVPAPADRDQDLQSGLRVIESRAEALSRFMAAYARLARLPAPRLGPVEVEEWVRRVAGLERRLPVTVRPGPALTIAADGDQLDQLLINLVANAVDAVGDRGGTVEVQWSRHQGQQLELRVSDDGPGLAGTTNLFVPFFTTKPSGSGIGLALSRQIAEAHGGSLTLANRPGRSGCEAILRLPVS